MSTDTGPTHLLRLVHPPVHEAVGRAFGLAGSNTASLAVKLGVIHHPGFLSGRVFPQNVESAHQGIPGTRRAPLLRGLAPRLHQRPNSLKGLGDRFRFSVPQTPAHVLHFGNDLGNKLLR